MTEIFPPSVEQGPVEYTIKFDPQAPGNIPIVTVRSSTSGDTHVVGAGSEREDALMEAAILIHDIMSGRNKPQQ